MNAGLKYVYTGNVPGQATENTYCPGCNCVVISRRGFSIIENRVENGKCPDCGASIAGVGL
jgi:pyruvate formate lyase activating enzyme